MRHTVQRQAILECLRASRSHPTAEQVHAAVAQAMPALSLATVYRNLARLVECGLVLELAGAGPQRRYDAVRDGHHHLFCRACGGVEDVYPRLPASVKEALIRDLDRPVSHFQMLFFGLCAACAPARATRERGDAS